MPKYNIYHALNEFNIWIDLIKTSILGEYTYGNFSYYFANVIMVTGHLPRPVLFIFTVSGYVNEAYFLTGPLDLLSFMVMSLF